MNVSWLLELTDDELRTAQRVNQAALHEAGYQARIVEEWRVLSVYKMSERPPLKVMWRAASLARQAVGRVPLGLREWADDFMAAAAANDQDWEWRAEYGALIAEGDAGEDQK